MAELHRRWLPRPVRDHQDAGARCRRQADRRAGHRPRHHPAAPPAARSAGAHQGDGLPVQRVHADRGHPGTVDAAVAGGGRPSAAGLAGARTGGGAAGGRRGGLRQPGLHRRGGMPAVGHPHSRRSAGGRRRLLPLAARPGRRAGPGVSGRGAATARCGGRAAGQRDRAARGGTRAARARSGVPGHRQPGHRLDCADRCADRPLRRVQRCRTAQSGLHPRRIRHHGGARHRGHDGRRGAAGLVSATCPARWVGVRDAAAPQGRRPARRAGAPAPARHRRAALLRGDLDRHHRAQAGRAAVARERAALAQRGQRRRSADLDHRRRPGLQLRQRALAALHRPHLGRGATPGLDGRRAPRRCCALPADLRGRGPGAAAVQPGVPPAPRRRRLPLAARRCQPALRQPGPLQRLHRLLRRHHRTEAERRRTGALPPAPGAAGRGAHA